MRALGANGRETPRVGGLSANWPPGVVLLTRLTATEGRRRMLALAASAAFFSLFGSGVEVLLPLWVTRDLGMPASAWATLRSTRFAGTLVGVIFLGALSDRAGQRLVGALSMLGTTAVMIILSLGGRTTLWTLFPVFGALVSTAFVNLNTLCQHVSDRRQGLANSIYRAVGAGVAILAPALATTLAGWMGGYRPVYVVYGGVLVVSAACLWLYPGEPRPPAFGRLGDEVRAMLRLYIKTMRDRDLMRFIHLSNLCGGTVAGVGAFAAIHFTKHMGMTPHSFGLLASLAGLLTFCATLAGGLFLDRVRLSRLMAAVSFGSSGAAVLMGATDSPAVTAAAFVAFSPVSYLGVAPVSMWVSRCAGTGSRAAVFTVHKIWSAGYAAVVMALLGLLENWLGIRMILVCGGALGIALSGAFLLLREPPRPGEDPSD